MLSARKHYLFAWRRLSTWVVAASLLSGCNTLLGNDEHGNGPGFDDSDATVIVEGGPSSGEAGVHDASVTSDGHVDGAVAVTDARGAEVSDGGGGADVAADVGAGADVEVTQEAGTVGVTCTADGGTCKPILDCHAGALTCADAGEVCVATTSLANGTPCGTDATHFCLGGTCAECNAGGDCSSLTAPCVVSTYDCSTGAAVCKFSRNVTEGMACGTGTPAMYCNAGICAACKVGNSCAPATNSCHVGTVTACTNGVATCMDTNASSPDGTSCTSGSLTGVCSVGKCTACTTAAPCNPGNNPCQNGTMSCSAGPACSLVSDVQDGTLVAACGTNEICLGGQCAVKCDATSCAGCCKGNTCEAVSSETTAMCGNGTAGATCGQCPIGICTSGTCACPSGQLDCSGVCAACATPPPGGASACSGTTCTFTCTAAGTTKCNGACLTLQNDNSNCGSCGNVCPTGTTCSGTSCICNTSSGCTGCCSGSTCELFLSESPTSCGAGGAVCKGCGTNQTCGGSGVCGCGSANFPTACGATCVNTTGDTSNCGSCGLTCLGAGSVPSTGKCATGLCQPFVLATASLLTPPLLVDATSLYATYNQAQAESINIKTGAAAMSANFDSAFDQLQFGSVLAQDANFLYASGEEAFGTGYIVTIAKGAALTVNLVQTTGVFMGTYNAIGVVGSGSTEQLCAVYTAQSPDGTMENGLVCGSAPATGLTANLTNLIDGCTQDGTTCVTTFGGVPNGMAGDLSGLVWGSDQEVVTLNASLTGGAKISPSSGSFLDSAIALNSTTAYWYNDDGFIYRTPRPISGTAVRVSASLTATPPVQLAIDTNYIYLTNTAAGTIGRIPIPNGTLAAPAVIASGQSAPTGIAVDATSVYWINSGNATVMKMTKPL